MKRTALLCCLRLLALAMGTGVACPGGPEQARAQAPAAPPAAAAPAPDSAGLLPIKEVNRILTDPSRPTPQDLRFAGTVIFVSQVGDLCIQDGAAGILVEPPSDTPRPRPGDRVEVTASVGYRTADLLEPSFYLPATAVRVTGPGTLPEPEKISLPAALQGMAAGRRVQVEGVVMQATLENGVVRLHLTDTSGWAVVNVHDWRSGVTTRDWWGARLRVTAANVGRGHTALRVTSSDDITVLRPGASDCFGGPLADPAALRKSGPAADRLRVAGTVLTFTQDEIYLRTDSGIALRSSLLAPYPPVKPEGHPLEMLAPRRPRDLKPGDRVELVASPLSPAPFLQMSFASLRVLAPAKAPPEPVDTAGKNPADFACDLVTLTGRVHWYEAGREARLELTSGGETVQAVLPPAAHPDKPEESWEPGTVVRLSGLVIPAEHGRPLTLRVTPGTVMERVSDPRSNWRALTPEAKGWIGFLAMGLVLALGGTWWMQRLVRQRTAALASANAALQAEVAVRQKAEDNLANALEQERELSELKSRFVSMVSHEFRTPLGITMSAVELLQHYEDRLPPEQKVELLGDIQRSTKNMAGLMEQVLLLGRVEAGRLAYRPLPLDIDILAQKLTDESLSATNRRCPIQWTAHNDLAGARGDEALLRHIFSNLLSNAVKYSPEGSTVQFTCRREGSHAVFTVEDRGIGIPPEERARLFEAFHRCTNVGDIPGTGLGLVIVKRCVDLHRGSLDLESEPGQGTTFTVRIPLFPEAPEKAE